MIQPKPPLLAIFILFLWAYALCISHSKSGEILYLADFVYGMTCDRPPSVFSLIGGLGTGNFERSLDGGHCQCSAAFVGLLFHIRDCVVCAVILF